tara:strand:+ start:3319 stop:6666 length:3348 start_codon:yes stop_codon:yes gene_type:complete
MNKQISHYINIFRGIKSKSDFKVSLIRINIFFLIVLMTLVLIESLFYLQPVNRYTLVTYFISAYIVFFSYALLKYIFNYYNLFNNSTDDSLAQLIGHKFNSIKDKLINAYQLEQNLDEKKEIEYELSIYAINKIKEDLSSLAISFNRVKIKYLLNRIYILSAFFIISIIISNSYTIPAINRLINPNKIFKVPLPFELINTTTDDYVFNGDNKIISIAGIGDLPDSIIVNYIIDESIKNIKIGHENEIFSHTFNNIQSNIIWWSNVYASSFFSPWDNIESSIDTIRVIKKPMISNLSFEIFPPEYTGLSSYKHPSNISNIRFPSGSNILINGSSDKDLFYAGFIMEDDTLSFEVDKSTFSGELILLESMKGSVICFDKVFKQMSIPIVYHFNADYDLYPTLSIIQPEYEFELDESNNIDLEIQVSDDYGLSDLWIEYSIIKPSYIESKDTNKYIYQINNLDTDAKIQIITHSWDISSINLSPEDEIHFTINVSDNNIFLPNITISKKMIGRYPTIEDLFQQMEEYEQNIDSQNEELISNVDQVQEIINEVKLDLLKSDEIGWDEKQEIDKAIEEMQNVFNQVEDIQKAIEKMQENAENNNLISDELMQKYDDFQDLLNEILTPELLDAMESIQELSQSSDLEELLEQLNNFEDSLSDFEEQIDRFIDMFEQAIAEQKIDEVIKKIESMLNQQINVLNKLDKENPDLLNLSSDERKIEEEYKNLQEDLQDAMKSSDGASPSTSKMFEDLMGSELNQNTQNNIKESRESLSKQEKNVAQEESTQAKENLSEMLEKSEEIKENFEEETVNEMINEFLSVVNSILNISRYQDDLSILSTGIRSSSPILPQIAKKQDKIRLQNKQLMEQILLLSRKTFYITPPIIRALGKASSAMDKSIGHLEQKKTYNALKEQLLVIEGLNETAYLLLNSMEEMLSSGSASGFENFMKQLEQLSSDQQGINQGTMQLPQLSMSGQQSMMQQLMAQQQSLKEGLEQLLNNMPSNSNTGGLGKASEDMEDIINDFKRNQVDRITKEKQQKILSRMLDSQKSLTKKDFSNNRKSESYSGNILRESPTQLSDDKGQNELLLINAMESALKEGHSNEYQELIKLYFYNLQKDDSD